MAFPFFKKDEKKTTPTPSEKEEVLEVQEKKSTDEKNKQTLEQKETSLSQNTHPADRKKFSVPHDTILVRPLVTEKALIQSQRGVYSFEVVSWATKISVKKALSNAYGVIPEKVRIIKRKGKHVRFGKISGKRKDEKRALVTLKKGQRIDL